MNLHNGFLLILHSFTVRKTFYIYTSNTGYISNTNTPFTWEIICIHFRGKNCQILAARINGAFKQLWPPSLYKLLCRLGEAIVDYIYCICATSSFLWLGTDETLWTQTDASRVGHLSLTTGNTWHLSTYHCFVQAEWLQLSTYTCVPVAIIPLYLPLKYGACT